MCGENIYHNSKLAKKFSLAQICQDIRFNERLTLELSRLRVGKARYIVRQLGWQDKVDNRGDSKSATANC
jgi:hypothetical protein